MTPDELRTGLSQLAVLGQKTRGAGDALRGQACERREAVKREAAELRAKAICDPDAEQRYLDLTEQDGRLVRMVQS